MSEITSGVKYLKINRLDADGEDYGSRIINADNIKINYSDVGSVLYDILTVQQQSDYYLLGIINQSVTSSNKNITEYTFTASYDRDVNAALGRRDLTDTGYWGISYNPLGLFSGVTGTYTLPSTPNIPLKFDIAIDFTAESSNTNNFGISKVWLVINNTTLFELFDDNFPIDLSPGELYRFGNTFTTTNSELPILDGTSYKLAFTQTNIPNGDTCRVEATWAIQNLTPSSSSPSSLFNISPDIVNFDNSDGNAIINNATIPQYSTTYQDIDYSIGLVPTNFNLLVSGNATYATVQDSNYTSTGWANSRYKGSRASSLDFNVTS